MSSVGSYLRELRERRGVSLDEISRSTRVLHTYLEALEADDFATLPAPTFIKGFIRAYCQALHEPPKEALARYEASRGETAEPRAAPRHDAPLPESLTRLEAEAHGENRGRGAVLVSFVLLVVLGVALFAVTLALQPAGERQGGQRAPASVEAPPAPEAPPASLTAETLPSVQPSVRPPTPAASGPTSPAAATVFPTVTDVASSYRLVARTSELTWVRVRTEDGRMTEENIPAGEIREWVSNRPFVLSIGNAGGVTLELNGRRLPPLGPRGSVIVRLVVPSEAQRPAERSESQ